MATSVCCYMNMIYIPSQHKKPSVSPLPTLFLLLSPPGGLASAAHASHGSDRGAGVRSPSVMGRMMDTTCNEGHKFRNKQRNELEMGRLKIF